MNLGNSDRFRNNTIWIFILCIVLLTLSDIVGLLTISFPFFGSKYAETFDMYFSFWSIWLVFMIAICCISKNRFILEKLKPLSGGNTVHNLLIGFALGFLTNSICALSAYLNGNISLSFSKFEPIPFIFMLAAVFVQSSAEELICRGFMYQRLAVRFKNPWIPLILTSLFFAALHLGNDSISLLALADLFMSGILFGSMIRYFDSLWMAMACHTAWNFNQNIVLGLPNSGTVSSYSVFVLDTRYDSSSFAYDTGFGLEGTVISVLVMVICFIGMYILHHRKNIST